MKRYLSIGLKIAVSVFGLSIVLRNMALGDIWTAMRSADVRWLGVAFSLIFCSLFLRAYRWQVLLEGIGAKVNYGRLVELYFVGSFFNAFLLSGVGGDVVRAFEASKDVSAERAAGTVIVDRLSGLLITFVFALCVLPFNPDTLPTTWFWLLLIISVSGLLGAFLLLSGWLYRAVDFISRRLFGDADNVVTRLTNKYLLGILNTARSCGWPAIARAFAVSFVFGLFLNGWWYATARAYALDVTYGYMFLVTPVMSLALLVPSFSGLGVRELLLPQLMVGSGVSAEEAVTFSLTIFLLLRTISLIGLPVYLRTTLRD